MKRLRAGNVKLSTHAYKRWKLRVNEQDNKKKIANRIGACIASELKSGADVNENGGLEIKIQPGIWAICYPSLMGGWEVATIIKEGWKKDMEERAIYGGGEDKESGENKLICAIEWFESAIQESNEYMADCSSCVKGGAIGTEGTLCNGTQGYEKNVEGR